MGVNFRHVAAEVRPERDRADVELGGGSVIPVLMVADRLERRSGLQDRLGPDVEECHDARGDLLAYCRAENGALSVDIPDLASFSYDCGASHVKAVPHRSLAPRFILDTYYHCVLPLILPALGTEVLHASAVLGTAGVAAFCGASGTGKSTIAAALAHRGHTIWADDAVAVDMSQPEPTTILLPFKGSSRMAPVQTESATLRALFVLQRLPDALATVTITRLEAAAACRTTLAHAYCFSVKDQARKRRTISNYLTICGQLPVYQIRFSPGLEHLPSLLDAIEEIIGCGSTDSK